MEYRNSSTSNDNKAVEAVVQLIREKHAREQRNGAKTKFHCLKNTPRKGNPQDTEKKQLRDPYRLPDFQIKDLEDDYIISEMWKTEEGNEGRGIGNQ